LTEAEPRELAPAVAGLAAGVEGDAPTEGVAGLAAGLAEPGLPEAGPVPCDGAGFHPAAAVGAIIPSIVAFGPAGARAGVGTAASAGVTASAGSNVGQRRVSPHCPQNFVPTTAGVPHLGQGWVGSLIGSQGSEHSQPNGSREML
jgi:hypothetical protein